MNWILILKIWCWISISVLVFEIVNIVKGTK